MKAGKKQAAKLKRRQEAFEKTMASRGIDTGAYTKPGSMNPKKAMPAGTRR